MMATNMLTLKCTNGDLFLCTSSVETEIKRSKSSLCLTVNKTKDRAWVLIFNFVQSYLMGPTSDNKTRPQSENDKNLFKTCSSENLVKQENEIDRMAFDSDWKTEYDRLIHASCDIVDIDMKVDLLESERDVIAKGDQLAFDYLTADGIITDNVTTGIMNEINDSDGDNISTTDTHVGENDTTNEELEAGVYSCQFCVRKFPSYPRLKAHLNTHTNDKEFKCNGHCDKSFGSKAQLIRHILRYTGTRNYNCVYCRKSFSTKGDLKSHYVTHNAIKSFQCSFCGKTFARMSQVTRHNLVHTGEKRYQCSSCGKSFSTVSYLKQHNYVHTGQRPRPYHCTVCGKSFSKGSHLTRHYKTNSHLHVIA